MYKHFLITRFNLRKSDWVTNKNNVAVLTDDWHRNRFQLFNEFCVPSVASQTNTNFEWLVFFDSSTKDEFRAIIKVIEKQIPNLKPFFIDGMDAFLPAIKEYISNCETDYIITSRMDNDDCLSRNFIASVQQKFKNQDFMAVDFINGFTLQIHPKVRLGKKLHQYNPFLSLIERNDNPNTIWSIPHNHWKKETSILQIKDEYVWCSIIHQENKVNEFTGFGQVDLTTFLDNFQISEAQVSFVNTNLEVRSQWKLLSFSNYISSYWSFHFKNIKKALGFYK
ncbi:glycosyltransferase [Winogradskyella aurantia]|uniref:Glycosyltransferase 2-like domain-containing protein n=1 Tax=Winogradskyella aurantia TaxID=1915063 RepID=A0A265UXL0_9FLAO|nr:glycosyltransferase [Winogradskyella aurantia]OZV70040.1 hypothetical protein CA834_05325 [Winogradskyella aurantia]